MLKKLTLNQSEWYINPSHVSSIRVSERFGDKLEVRIISKGTVVLDLTLSGAELDEFTPQLDDLINAANTPPVVGGINPWNPSFGTRDFLVD